jgi:hypothetical protein
VSARADKGGERNEAGEEEKREARGTARFEKARSKISDEQIKRWSLNKQRERESRWRPEVSCRKEQVCRLLSGTRGRGRKRVRERSGGWLGGLAF